MRLRDGSVRNPPLNKVLDLRNVIRGLGFRAGLTVVDGELGLHLDHDFDPEGIDVPAVYGRRKKKKRDKNAHHDSYHTYDFREVRLAIKNVYDYQGYGRQFGKREL